MSLADLGSRLDDPAVVGCLTRLCVTTTGRSYSMADESLDDKLLSGVSIGETQIVPPVHPPKKSGMWLFNRERDERNQIEKDGSQSHNIRRIAAYGAILFAGFLYVAGVIAIMLFLGLTPWRDAATSDMWHIVVAVLIALFTVPTVLIIAVLRVTSPAQASELPTTLHEALGKMLEKIVDKVTG